MSADTALTGGATHSCPKCYAQCECPGGDSRAKGLCAHPCVQTEIMPLVLSDMRGRVEHQGMKTYCRPFTSHDGRDPLTDAYEEALDLAMYLRKALFERDGK